MKNRIKLVLYLKDLDPSGIAVFANTILMAMTDNPNFPNATAYLTLLATGITDLQTAITAPSPSPITIKAKVVYIEKVLNALRAHVELECNDDEDKAASSGFTLRAPSVHKPKAFNATQGQLSGTVTLESPYAGSRAAYVWELISDPINQNTWQILRTTNTTSTVVTGLTPGNKYWFRVKAIVRDEEQPYTDPHMVHVV